MTPEARRACRQQHAVPLLAEINAVRDAIAATALSKSPLGDAVRYLTNQWDALQRYVHDGRLAIDINRAENQLRVVAVGRENWLFAGSFDGATRAALLYSLVQSCTLIRVSPLTCLKDVLLRIATHPHQRLDQLTPWRWAATSVPGRRLTSFTVLGRLARRHDGVRRTLTPVRSTAPGLSGQCWDWSRAQLTVRLRQAEKVTMTAMATEWGFSNRWSQAEPSSQASRCGKTDAYKKPTGTRPNHTHHERRDGALSCGCAAFRGEDS
jgi:hypothetical protein